MSPPSGYPVLQVTPKSMPIGARPEVQSGAVMAGRAPNLQPSWPGLGSEDDGPSALQAARRRPLLVVLAALAGALLAAGWVFSRPASFTASTSLVLSDPWQADQGTTAHPVGGDYQRFVRAQATFVHTAEVLDPAAAALGLERQKVERAIVADVGTASDVLHLTAEGDTKAEAERRLAAVIDAYSRARRSDVTARLGATLATIEEEARSAQPETRTELEARAASLRVAVATYGDGLSFRSDSPTTADQGLSQQVGLPLGGLLLGGGLGVVLAWLLAARRPAIEEPEAFALAQGLPFLGVVPALRHGGAEDSRARSARESTVLALAKVLRACDPRHGGRTYAVVVVPLVEGGAAGATARALADAAAAHGATTRVVDVAADGQRGNELTDELLTASEVELLLLACPAPAASFASLRLAVEADATVAVLPPGADARQVRSALQRFASAGLSVSGLIDPGHTRPPAGKVRR